MSNIANGDSISLIRLQIPFLIIFCRNFYLVSAVKSGFLKFWPEISFGALLWSIGFEKLYIWPRDTTVSKGEGSPPPHNKG